jgi:acetyl-CoA carboxylase biotin carboxyl carrier protein
MDQEAYNQVEALLRLFREHRLTELTIEEGTFKLRLGRGEKEGNPLPRAAAAAQPAAPPRPRRAGKGRTVAVRSPLIGVFYRSSAPDADPFVEVGDVVSEGQTVCVIEAMKVFNEIKAEWRGRVVATPAENGALVQAGDPLIVLEFVDEGKEGDEA